MYRNRHSLKFWLLSLHWVIISVPVNTFKFDSTSAIRMRRSSTYLCSPGLLKLLLLPLQMQEIWPHMSAICNSIYETSATCKMKKNGACLSNSSPWLLIGCFSIPAWLKQRSHPEQGGGRGLRQRHPFAGRNEEEEVGCGEGRGGRKVTRIISGATIDSDGGGGRTVGRIRGGAIQKN